MVEKRSYRVVSFTELLDLVRFVKKDRRKGNNEELVEALYIINNIVWFLLFLLEKMRNFGEIEQSKWAKFDFYKDLWR